MMAFCSSPKLQGVESGPAHTKRMPCAFLLAVSLFRFANVISLSASRCVSFAFAHVVRMLSCLTSDVTKLRSSACRWAELRLKCRYLTRPPAILFLFRRLTGRQEEIIVGDLAVVEYCLMGDSLKRPSSNGALLFLVAISNLSSGTHLSAKWPELSWEIFGSWPLIGVKGLKLRALAGLPGGWIFGWQIQGSIKRDFRHF